MKTETSPKSARAPQPAKKIVQPSAPRPKTRPKGKAFSIVGIGASAGGLEAMSQLLKTLPAETGMAFVLVQHLDPTHESALTSLLSRLTSMAVCEAKNNMPLEPNTLYVIPPNKVMGISERQLKLTPRKDSKEIYTPIDHFLRSLAEEEGNRAVAIILSGSGSDGTQGLLAIKAAGGITFAQDDKTSKYPTMPVNAVAAGCVDFVMPPDKIGRELSRIAGHPLITPSEEELERASPSDEKLFEEVVALLRQRMGVDFANYKHATLRRRIQRRMVLHKFESLKDYTAYLRAHAAEVKELFTDILIHVTGFFRDSSVFQLLKKRIFPRLIKNKTPEAAIRIWVPGCSTGEEVYSLAMALMEFLHDKKANHTVQIFGTDINDMALDKARSGLFPDGIQADVSPNRLRRFFLKTEGGYRINKAVREMCIFARQNVVTDPPFSNLDLISCRNVLIYLGPVLQRKVMPLFHYALKPDGYLLLGVSETIGGFADLFALIDKKAKFYAKKTTRVRPAVTLGHAPVLKPNPALAAATAAAATAATADLGPTLADVQKQGDRIVLTHHSPAGVIVNKQMEVLQFRGRTGPYLEHAHGEATLNLLKMAREGLVVNLRAALARAVKQNARVREESIHVKQNGNLLEVNIEVVPFQVPPSRERFFLVLFETSAPPVTEAVEKKIRAKKERAFKSAESVELTRLREELASTRESLQAIIEEQEATNEELRSANEEIMSSNEELQSTNEELETAKEELQSTNEELTTLNDELESRNVELEQVNNDLHNLLASINIPIIMVGPDLRIRRFTGVAEKLLNLIPGDVGRPLTDINLHVDVPSPAKLVAEVIDTLQTRELDVRDKDGHWWSVRIRPYKTTDNKIDGAVIALLDVDLLKTSAEQVRRGRALAETVVNAVHRPLVVMDNDLVVQQVNEAFLNTFKTSAAEILHHRIYEVNDGEWNNPKLRTLLEEILPHNGRCEEFVLENNFPKLGRRRIVLSASRLPCDEGKTQLILLSIENVSNLPDSE
jgi:two-component system CheB/CheR fusion protein